MVPIKNPPKKKEKPTQKHRFLSTRSYYEDFKALRETRTLKSKLRV